MVHYRTGDLCYADAEGDILYLGRLDQQVKIQGFRVELGEIEHHACELAGLDRAVAVSCPDERGNLVIHLYLENFSGEVGDLLARLTTRLPSYMMPAKTHNLAALPMNVNGKIDRPALLQHARGRQIT